MPCWSEVPVLILVTEGSTGTQTCSTCANAKFFSTHIHTRHSASNPAAGGTHSTHAGAGCACAHGPASVRGQRGVVTGKRRMLPPLVSVTALPKLRCGAVKPARAGEKAPSRPAIERRLQKARARRQHGAPQNGAATLHGPARRSRRHSRPRDDVDQVSPLPARRGHVAISQS